MTESGGGLHGGQTIGETGKHRNAREHVMRESEDDQQVRTNSGVDASTALPEDLNELRATVEGWLKKAREAVWSFGKNDGSFQRDSATSDRPSITTTALLYGIGLR
jgi:hypothetical protein